MDTLDDEEHLDPRVKRTIGLLETWESSHMDEMKEQKRNAEQAVSDAEIVFLLDRIIPDGGSAWLLVLSTWISNGITNGVSFAYGLLLSGIVDAISMANVGDGGACSANLSSSGGGGGAVTTACPKVSGDASELSLPLLATVGTVHSFLLYFTTPVILLYSYRVRRLSDLAFTGALLTSLGLFLSAITDYKRHSILLLMHFSVTAGLGLAIQTTLQATILSNNFNRRMSIAAGITSSGNGMFSGLLSIGVSVLNAKMGVRFSFLLLTALSLPSLVYAQFWKANRDFLMLQKWVRTPMPLFTELLTYRIMRNRRYVTLFLSMLCLYSGLFYPWMMLMESAKASLTKSQLSYVAYVYTTRGFCNAVFRCMVGFAATNDSVRRRLLQILPVGQSMYLCGLIVVIMGLQSASLPMLFVAAVLTAIGESLVITTMPSIIAVLTNPADAPAGLVLMNLTFSIASLVSPTLLSIVTDSIGGNFLPSFIACCCFNALGVLLSATMAIRLPCGGSDDCPHSEAVGEHRAGEGYITLDTMAQSTSIMTGVSRISVEGAIFEGQRNSVFTPATASFAERSSRQAIPSRMRSSMVRSSFSLEKSRLSRMSRLSSRALKLNAYKVTAWRQQECNVGSECFEEVGGSDSGVTPDKSHTV